MGGFSTVTPPPSQVSATSVAQAVWSYSPRSLTDIQSLTAAIQNNDPNILTAISDLQYVPVPYYAGQVSLTQVAAFIDNAIRNYGLVNPIANFIANSPYNLWTTNFVASLAANPYLSTTSLNMLLSNANMSANYAQFLLYQLAQNYYYNKWILTVTANVPSSITFSTNATLSTNVLIAQNITIASGVTVTCGTTTCFFVAQSFNNYGTIVAYGAPGGLPSTSSMGNYGGTGGGGIVVIAITAALGTLNVNGVSGGNASNYLAASNGYSGTNGVFYVLTGFVVPTGAGSTYYSGTVGHNGGAGGGAFSFAAGAGYNGGNGGNATVHSFSSPNTMVTYILQGLSDWWLINVLAKAPSSTTPLAFMYGSGGGGGASASGYGSGGGAGGGGGEVVAYGYNILSGNIIAAGGNGGAGYNTNNSGGGGGGGGLVFIFYGATSGTVTANVAGGIGGNGAMANGLTGANGTYYVGSVTVNG